MQKPWLFESHLFVQSFVVVRLLFCWIDCYELRLNSNRLTELMSSVEISRKLRSKVDCSKRKVDRGWEAIDTLLSLEEETNRILPEDSRGQWTHTELRMNSVNSWVQSLFCENQLPKLMAVPEKWLTVGRALMRDSTSKEREIVFSRQILQSNLYFWTHFTVWVHWTSKAQGAPATPT